LRRGVNVTADRPGKKEKELETESWKEEELVKVIPTQLGGDEKEPSDPER